MKRKLKDFIAFANKIINLTKKEIQLKSLKNEFKNSKKSFTRNRKLTFDKMLVFLLQKTIKSLQLKLNEIALKIDIKVSGSAFSQSRKKISYKVFEYLNTKIIIENFYNIKENIAGFETYKNLRILAVDGSKLRLPDSKQIKDSYGLIKNINRNKKESFYSGGLLSVIYDPLNNLAIDSILEKGNFSERALTITHLINMENLPNIIEKDLIIFDRGYFSSFLSAIILAYKKDFLFRIKSNAIKDAKELFCKNSKVSSKIITLKVNNQESEYKEKYGIILTKKLEFEVKIRLVRVILDDGEVEVLATSLLDENKYKSEIFKELYYKRWGVEVFYDILKNRLGLENFTGLTVNSVLQDLYSSIFLSNFETIITRPADFELREKSNKLSKRKKSKSGKYLKMNKQKVNKQVSFNFIKNTLIEMFIEDKPTEEILKIATGFFKTNPSQERPGRKRKRGTTIYKTADFLKRRKKSIY